MSYVARILECTRFDLSHVSPFFVSDDRLGWIHRALRDCLTEWPDIFDINDEKVALSPKLATLGSRTSALDTVVRELVRKGIIPNLHGERRAASRGLRRPPSFLIDRAAAPYLASGFTTNM